MYFNPLEQFIENSLFDLVDGKFLNNFWCGDDFVPLANFFDYFDGKQPSNSSSSRSCSCFNPRINITEDINNYYIHVDLPGMTKDQVKMEFNEEKRILTIAGERKSPYDSNQDETLPDHASTSENATSSSSSSSSSNNNNETTESSKNEEKNEMKFVLRESRYGKFSRTFPIPKNCNLNNIKAKMENGLLEVIINKIEHPKNQKRSIQIQ